MPQQLREARFILFALAIVTLAATVPAAWWIAAAEEQDRPHGAFLVTMALLAATILLSGRAVTGRWLGALIDQRRKFSMSRLQTVLWTVVIVSAVFSLALARAQADADALVPTPPSEMADASDAEPEPTRERLDFEIPIEVWALLGISASTLVAAGIVKNENQNKGRLHVNADADGAETFAQASIVDLVSGETEATRASLDMGKVQALFFTVLVVFIYAATVWREFDAAISDIAGLPVLEDGLIALIGISHGTYIVAKAVPSGTSTDSEDGERIAEGSTEVVG